jgi:hypothetical protein
MTAVGPTFRFYTRRATPNHGDTEARRKTPICKAQVLSLRLNFSVARCLRGGCCSHRVALAWPGYPSVTNGE